MKSGSLIPKDFVFPIKNSRIRVTGRLEFDSQDPCEEKLGVVGINLESQSWGERDRPIFLVNQSKLIGEF